MLLRQVVLLSMLLVSPAGPLPAPGERPLTLAASNIAGMTAGKSWYLSVNSAGQAELTVDGLKGPASRRFDVPPEQMAALRTALADERFMELGGAYGQRVTDDSDQNLTVTLGERTASVTVHFLMNWVVSKELDKLREPCRAVRILVLVRGLFEDATALDLRPWDQTILDSVK